MVENRNFARKIVLKSILNGGIRSFVIFASIFISAAVISAFACVYADIEAKVSKELNSYGANLVITPKIGHYIDENELNEKFSQMQNLRISNSYLFGLVSLGKTSAIMMGTKFSALKDIMPFIDIKEGKISNFDFDDRNILVGAELAKLADIKLGDELEISLPNQNKTHKVIVRAIIQSGDKEDKMVISSLMLSQKILGKDSVVNYANAIIDAKFDEISQMNQSLSNENLAFEVVNKISKTSGAILEKIKLLMALVSIVILVITSVCVNTSLSAILLSRIKEIALLRALGASKKNIISFLGAEILIISLFGAIFGSLFGFILAQILGAILFSASIDFRLISLILAVFISIICAFFASFYPIKKALNKNIANLLRGE